MIWLPGVGEVPMSLSIIDIDGDCGFTVKSAGETSKALCALTRGELIGIRGPYGNGFTIISGTCLVVGGGIGLAPLIPLSHHLKEKGSSITFLLAFKSKPELFFMKETKTMLFDTHNKLFVTTDDGTYGIRGTAIDYFKILLKSRRFDMIYTCGPEVMMKKILDLSKVKKIPMQASLERYMKCGFGFCGSCALGKYLVCQDGPVFTSNQLEEVSSEFGVFRRDSAGRKIYF
jgi:dihydroorotate dehydrogenase electron transfer subunit